MSANISHLAEFFELNDNANQGNYFLDFSC